MSEFGALKIQGWVYSKYAPFKSTSLLCHLTGK